MSIAPAMTLNGMYHWVPSSISAMDAISTPPRKRIKKRRKTRSMRSMVDLPQPEGPSKAIIWPGEIAISEGEIP
jgi:hypothetical protein